MDLSKVTFRKALPRRTGRELEDGHTRMALHHGGARITYAKISMTIGRSVVKSLRWQRGDRVDHAWDYVDGKLVVHLWREPLGDLKLGSPRGKNVGQSPKLSCGLTKRRVEQTIGCRLQNSWGAHETEHQVMASDNSLVMSAPFPEMVSGLEAK